MNLTQDFMNLCFDERGDDAASQNPREGAKVL
jgi:hypothetical protein